MVKILVEGEELEAAEGPLGLKVWPPEALEKIVHGFKDRFMCANGYQMNQYGTPVWHGKRKQKVVHHSGRPKGSGSIQFQEGIKLVGKAAHHNGRLKGSGKM